MRKFSIRDKILAGIGAIIGGILLFFGERIGEIILNLSPALILSVSLLVQGASIVLMAIGIFVVVYGINSLKRGIAATGSSGSGMRRLPQARIEVKDKTFEHQDVLLDGHTWERCTFNSCNLVVGTGDFALLYSNFSKCELVPHGIAAQVLRLAYYLYPGIPLKLAPGEVETNKVIKD